MTARIKSLWVLGATFLMTVSATSFKDFDAGNAEAIWVIWAGFSWNYFAFGFERQMLPWVWVELQGRGQGSPTERQVVFWATAAIYLAFLSLAVFSD
jgi:hypothetical protein